MTPIRPVCLIRSIRPWLAALALASAGCAHAHDAEVVSSYEPRSTIGQTFTADTTRLVTDEHPGGDAGLKALTAVVEAQLATVGRLRPEAVDREHIELVVELPAPGWAVRVRIAPKPDQMALVTVEPVAMAPSVHAVDATPWSVQDSFEMVRGRVAALLPPKLPPMDAARFDRLRAEATEAAAAGRDPLLSPSEFVRVPRPISDEGVEAPYYTPPPPTP
jgi:hypothetical protein